MTDGTFTKVGDSDQCMYGRRGILASGYEPDTHARLLWLLEKIELNDIPVIFVTDDDADTTLKDLFCLEPGKGNGLESGLKRAIVMSGLTEKELKTLMAAYRHVGGPPTMWATLTPASENWTIRALLDELTAEAEAFRRRSQPKA